MRGDRGQASTEFLGMLALLLLGAMVVWQLMLTGWAVESASNAARTGSRMVSRGAPTTEAERGAVASLSSPLRRHARARAGGERTVVRVRVPVLIPGLTVEDLTVRKSATFPKTS